MRISMIGRLLAILLLLGGVLAVPVFDTQIVSVMADEGKDESGQNEKDDKDDDKDKKDKKDKDKDKNNEGSEINPSAEYTVEVECDYDDSADTTTCTFTGVAPEGEKDVSHVDLSEDAVCAEVLGGDHEYVDPDPNTRVTGYKSRGSEGAFTLELQGEVTVGGTTTYWFKTGNGVFPANGPGLDCDGTTAEAQTATDSTEATAGTTTTFELTTPAAGETPAETPATAETGELVVLIYTCTDVPEDTAGYDWFGLCDPEGGVHELALAPAGDAAAQPVTMATNESGDLTFAELETGTYTLKLTEGSWCKAVSDNVNADGSVNIEAGARTTVYAFMCDSTPKP